MSWRAWARAAAWLIALLAVLGGIVCLLGGYESPVVRRGTAQQRHIEALVNELEGTVGMAQDVIDDIVLTACAAHPEISDTEECDEARRRNQERQEGEDQGH